MEMPSLALLASMILTSPAWCRVGITAPREQLREQAAEEMARHIEAGLTGSPIEQDARQMPLPL